MVLQNGTNELYMNVNWMVMAENGKMNCTAECYLNGNGMWMVCEWYVNGI